MNKKDLFHEAADYERFKSLLAEYKRTYDDLVSPSPAFLGLDKIPEKRAELYAAYVNQTRMYEELGIPE